MTKRIICIIGTTGVGKSQLSIHLAQGLSGEIINADSMQMYKSIPQITNKHPLNERMGIPHHVMDHILWSQPYHIHKFQEDCQNAINSINLPIIVGGTHYYLQSVLFNNKTISTNGQGSLTKEQKEVLESEDYQFVWDKLNILDPEVSVKFHPKDIRRVKRALELIYLSKEKTSEVYSRQRKEIDDKGLLKYNVLFLWVYSKLDVLDKRLDDRVDKMFLNGAIQELNQLFEEYQNMKAQGGDLTSGVWQVIGFKEFLPYLEANGPITEPFDDLKNKKEFVQCLDEMKLRTRQYARRQIKWIKNQLIPELQNESKVMILDATNLENFESEVELRGFQITNQFINDDTITIDQIPQSLQDENLVNLTKKKLKWEHHECEICTDKQGKPMVFVGDQWEIHLKGRKHKFNISRGQKKREYEEWLKQNN